MAQALTPSPSSNTRRWWSRLSASNNPSSSSLPTLNLYSDISTYTGQRPHTAPGAIIRHLFMTSVTNPNPTSPNTFTVSKSSSRFNLAAVIGFGSRSKKQQPVDIQDPPPHVRPLLPTRHFSVSSQPLVSPDPSLSHGLASAGSRTSGASTDGPLTPADDPLPPGIPTSYQHSLMSLTDTDLFSPTVPFNDRRSSSHSDKSLSRRLMQKLDGKSAKASTRLPVGDGSKRERSATLPTRSRTSGDPLEAYQPLRAVEPPWATSDHSETHFMTSPRAAGKDYSRLTKSVSSGAALRHSKSSKAAREGGSSQSHQRKNSSSSILKESLTDIRRAHSARPSISSSIQSSTIQSSPASTTSILHLPVNHSRPRSGSEQSAGVRYIPSLSRGSSAKTLPNLPTHVARASPRPPPTAELPPTPTLPQTLEDHHPLRPRSATATSVSSVSFTSSLSSLSFNSRPSPQDPPAAGSYDYPSLLNETLPVSGEIEVVSPRRGNKLGLLTGSHKDTKAKGPALSPTDTSSTPKKTAFPRSRPLPTPPVAGVLPSGIPSITRERALSAVGPIPDVAKTVRKQRSFHNTSNNAPAPLKSTLKHRSSFDPSVAHGAERSPPLPPLHFPSQQDSSPLPSPLTSIAKRTSAGKDSVASPSPRRKLFGTNKHDRDRERERKHELDHVDTSVPTSVPTTSVPGAGRGSTTSSSTLTHSSSSWFDDRGTGSEPASASSVSPSIMHDVAQHIVPPAELLRLGAAWEQENDGRNGLRRTKSSWGSDTSRTSGVSASLKTPVQPSARNSSSPPPGLGAKLSRSASLLSKASSAPSFGRTRGAPHDLSFAPSTSPLPLESYTSLSPPPPRRPQRSSPRSPSGFPPLSPRRRPSTSALSSRSMPPKGALIERKPSFLDMTTTRQSVTLDVPESSDGEEYEQDSFLELSRGANSIDTIRESISSMDSFMQ